MRVYVVCVTLNASLDAHKNTMIEYKALLVFL